MKSMKAFLRRNSYLFPQLNLILQQVSKRKRYDRRNAKKCSSRLWLRAGLKLCSPFCSPSLGQWISLRRMLQAGRCTAEQRRWWCICSEWRLHCPLSYFTKFVHTILAQHALKGPLNAILAIPFLNELRLGLVWSWSILFNDKFPIYRSIFMASCNFNVATPKPENFSSKNGIPGKPIISQISQTKSGGGEGAWMTSWCLHRPYSKHLRERIVFLFVVKGAATLPQS